MKRLYKRKEITTAKHVCLSLKYVLNNNNKQIIIQIENELESNTERINGH